MQTHYHPAHRILENTHGVATSALRRVQRSIGLPDEQLHIVHLRCQIADTHARADPHFAAAQDVLSLGFGKKKTGLSPP